MKSTIHSNLITSIQLQNAAKCVLEYAKEETDFDGKRFLSQQITRIQANLNACYANISDDESRKVFAQEVTKTDALLYANVFLLLLDANPEQKLAIEKMITAISKGEIIVVEEN